MFRKAVLVIALLAPLTLLAASQPPRNSSRQHPLQITTLANPQTTQPQSGTDGSPFVVKLTNTGKSDQAAKQEADDLKDQTAVNEVIAAGTVILALFTVVLAFTGIYQARISSKTAKQELRAYIGIDEYMPKELPKWNRDGTLEVLGVVTNYGETPAYKLGHSLNLRFVEKSFSEEIAFPDYKTGIRKSETINPGQTVVLSFKTSSDDPISSNDKLRLYTGASKKRLYAYGFVVYDDAFEDSHYSNFCFELKWDRDSKINPSWMTYGSHNDSD